MFLAVLTKTERTMRERVAAVRAQTTEKLVINLWKNPDGAIFARSVEIMDKVSRVRFSFNADCMIESVFNSRAMHEIRAIIDRMADRRGILALPDLRIDLKDLVLEGCRVLVTAAEDGIETIMVRFVRYFGRVLSLFQDGFSHRDCLADTAVDQAVSALEKVYMPLRNFSVYLDDLLANFPHLLDREKISFLQRIRDEISGMGHVSDIIVHYVNAQGAIGANEPVPRLDERSGSIPGFAEPQTSMSYDDLSTQPPLLPNT